MHAEEDITLQCPFCFEHISIRIDLTAGDSQDFIYDCEVCCRPIDIKVRRQSNGEIAIVTDD